MTKFDVAALTLPPAIPIKSRRRSVKYQQEDDQPVSPTSSTGWAPRARKRNGSLDCESLVSRTSQDSDRTPTDLPIKTTGSDRSTTLDADRASHEEAVALYRRISRNRKQHRLSVLESLQPPSVPSSRSSSLHESSIGSLDEWVDELIQAGQDRS